MLQIRNNMSQPHIPLRVNMALTKSVIALHGQGYVLDFSVTSDHRIICIQDNQLYTLDQVIIKVVDQRFDDMAYRFKYIHTVETCCGDRGLLIDYCICINAMLAGRLRRAPSLVTEPIIGLQLI